MISPVQFCHAVEETHINLSDDDNENRDYGVIKSLRRPISNIIYYPMLLYKVSVDYLHYYSSLLSFIPV